MIDVYGAPCDVVHVQTPVWAGRDPIAAWKHRFEIAVTVPELTVIRFALKSVAFMLLKSSTVHVISICWFV
jgi:hypothetical protein